MTERRLPTRKLASFVQNAHASPNWLRSCKMLNRPRIARSCLLLLTLTASAFPQSTETWIIPVCYETNPRIFLSAGAIEFRSLTVLPKGARIKVKSYSSADDSSNTVTLTMAGRRFVLTTMHGMVHEATDALVAESPSFSKRTWEAPSGGPFRDGVDLRGTAPNGTRWRWLGPPISMIATYRNASPEAAAIFDSILDTMCIRPSTP